MLLPRSSFDDITDCQWSQITRSGTENLANTNVGAILAVTVDAGITLNNSHYNFGDSGNLDFASFRLIAVEGGVQLQTRQHWTMKRKPTMR